MINKVISNKGDDMIPCTQEKVITEIRVDQKWTQSALKDIKETNLSLNKKFDTVLKSFQDDEIKIARLNKTVYGNGVKGVEEEVSNMKTDLSNIKTEVKLEQYKVGVISGLIVSVATSISIYFIIKWLG